MGTFFRSAGIATGLRYEISDVLDYRLTYQGNILVTVVADDTPAKTDGIRKVAEAAAASKRKPLDRKNTGQPSGVFPYFSTAPSRKALPTLSPSTR